MTESRLSIIISFSAFILSLISWIYTLILQRKKLKINLISIKYSDTAFFPYIVIENRSRVSISLTLIEVSIDGKWIKCTPEEKSVFERRTRDYTPSHPIIDIEKTRSLPMPTFVPAMGAVGGFILFENLQAFPKKDSKSLSFGVSATRGKAFEISLPLDPDWGNQAEKY